MGDYFRVEVEELDRLALLLRQSRDDLLAALAELREVGPVSESGSAMLDRAGGEFSDGWASALGRIAEAAEQIENGLRDTRREYLASEEAIRASFGP